MRKQAVRRPMLNEPTRVEVIGPDRWGPADALPGGRERENGSFLDRWRVEGNLHPAVEAAAYEIENVHRANISGLWTKTARYGEQTSGGPDTDWPAYLAIAKRDRYTPWQDAMSVLYKQTKQPVMEVVIDAVADNRSFRQIDGDKHWRKGTASRIVRWGLWQYAVMAGWVKAVDEN